MIYSLECSYFSFSRAESVVIHNFKIKCRPLNICGIIFSQLNNNGILAQFNFYIYDIPRLQIVKQI